MTSTCTRCGRAADPDTDLLVVVLGVPLCSACAEQKAEEMDGTRGRPMDEAPKDGTEILIHFRHQNWQYAKTAEEKARWEENCIAKWIDHNGGGWTWHGIAGQPVEWWPLPSANPVTEEEAYIK